MQREKPGVAAILICLAFIIQNVGNSQGFGGSPAPASIKWQQVNTDRARVIFPKGLDSPAIRIANVTRLLADQTAKTIGGRQKKWTIILQNQTTIPGAYVRLAPVMSEFYLTPNQNNFSKGSLRWDDNLTAHENRHMQQFSNFTKGFSKAFSFLLGQEGQLLAVGLTVPDYFLEGDAVWQETLVSAHGRSSFPAFYKGFKSLWISNKNYSWMKLRNGSYKDFVPDHYALGYHLTAYGYEKYGEDFWNKVTNDAVRFKGVFYPFSKAIERHSGKSYKQFRNDAQQNFKEKTLPLMIGSSPGLVYLTNEQKSDVVDYQYPYYINDDSLLVTKKSYKEVNAFYILSSEKETRLRVRDMVIDDNYSYRNGKIVYAAYVSDPRWWQNRDYSVIKLLDIHSGRQKQITKRSKYFSPDINAMGTEILAVNVGIEGVYNLCRIDVMTGKLIYEVPNPDNYFYTQTRYIDSNTAVSACRNRKGDMALVIIDLTNGITETLTPFSFSAIGYPFVKGDTVYFNASDQNADKIFAISISDKQIYRLTNNINGIYHPMVNTKRQLFVSAFTAGGYRLARLDLDSAAWEKFPAQNFIMGNNKYYRDPKLKMTGAGALKILGDSGLYQDLKGNLKNPVTKYKKSFRLFNFHSWRPIVDDPEYGYIVYSDNVLSTFKNSVFYSYNRTDFSHTVGLKSEFKGWFPVFTLGAEKSFNRSANYAPEKSERFNTVKLNASTSIPLYFAGGRTSQFLNFVTGYNVEQFYFNDAEYKNFQVKALNYLDASVSFSNVSQQAYQHVNPRWGQSISVNYKDAFNLGHRYKFVAESKLYFPGLFKNHSLMVDFAYQNKDTLTDLYSKTFPYSRGYEALSTWHMYKLGTNYSFTLMYPDWGFANLFYVLRIRANVFFDYTNARTKSNNAYAVINRTPGAEFYFDTKIWNSFPVTFGFRFSHLMDTPQAKNRWEVIIPVGFIPD